MSTNPISKDTNDLIERMMSTALGGDLKGANAVLQQLELTKDQKAKIEGILNKPRSDMRRCIVEVVENITSTVATIEQAPSEQCVSFADISTAPFGNAYPCKFEFGGKHYQSATACFLAQQYTDQPEIMNLFTNLGPEEATALAELTPVTEERKTSWENPVAEHINKDDVLMHVQRAKFGQNPDLKKQLLATKGVYLVCQGHGVYLSDNFDGTGKNALGVSLMRLRGEYRNSGQVEPPAEYHSAIESLQVRCHDIANGLYPDIMELLLNRYFSGCDFKTLTEVARVNKHWNKCTTEVWDKQDLKELCPELTILDAKAQGVQCEDEPKISKLRLLKWVREISPHVERNAGVTQLTMTKGTTFNQLIEIAKGEGITVSVGWNRISKELGDVPVEQTYGILITNNVFTNSRNQSFNLQKILVEGHGCLVPTVQEYVALCVYTNKVFKKCLYGQNPWTYGCSSTRVDNIPLVVGGSAPASFIVFANGFDYERRGAGGQRKF